MTNRVALAFALAAVALAPACTKDKADKAGDDKPVAAAPKAIDPGTPAPAAAPAIVPAAAGAAKDMKTLKAVAAGWEGEYNQALSSWTFEKYTPGANDMNEPNRMYIDLAADDAPTTVDAYAAKLQEKNWMDFSFVYSSITEKKAIDGGFLITGVVQDTTDATAKPVIGFVMVRDASGAKLRCHSGPLVSEKLRAEAEALCASAKL